MDNNERNAQGLLKELEEKHGGKITKRSFATWAKLPTNRVFEHGMFVFKINDTFHYEDFEKDHLNILGFQVQKKDKTPFVQTEGSFKEEEIEKVTRLTKARAKCLTTLSESEIHSLKRANPLQRFFFSCVDVIILKNGDVYSFELINNIFK